jgi:hypothetical protein
VPGVHTDPLELPELEVLELPELEVLELPEFDPPALELPVSVAPPVLPCVEAPDDPHAIHVADARAPSARDRSRERAGCMGER